MRAAGHIVLLVASALAGATAACRQGESLPPAPPAPTGAIEDAGLAAAPPPPPQPPPPLDLPLPWNRLPLLPPGVRPQGWDAATATWATATAAYARGEVETASKQFMAVAMGLRGEAGAKGAGARVAATARCLAYENAGRALEASRAPDRARALLEGAADDDPACQHSLVLRVARLERDVETASSADR